MEAYVVVPAIGSTLDDNYATYFRDLVRLCRALGAGAESEDIAQEAILYARAHEGQLRDPGKVTAWLRQIARHAVSRHFRKRRLAVGLGPLVFAPRDPDERLDLAAAIATLSRREQQVLALTYALGYSQADIANALGIARGTVAATLFHARAQLVRRIGYSRGAR